MRPAVVRLVVVVTVLALALGGVLFAISALVSGSGSSGSDGPFEPAPTGTAAPGSDQPPVPELAAFYGQELTWERCREKHECATLSVPLDYAEPGGETIELALLRVPATGARVGSLVVNPGGPGAPGTSYAQQAPAHFGPALTGRYDVVGFDPRGTGASAPVDCLSDEELDAFLAADPAPDDPAEAEEHVAMVRALGRGCAARSAGGLARHVSTVEAARDMDVLRSALGEATLAYYGASYGTKLGATYAELFPDRVGRLVLDGGVDVSLGSRDLSLGQAGGFETALRAYVQHCVDGGDCFLGDDLEAGLDRVSGFLDEVDAEPLPTSDGRELAAGNAFLGIVTPLYVRDYWRLLDQGLQSAFGGDGTVLMLLADAYAARGRDGQYLDNSAEAIYAVNCLDDPTAVPAEQVPDEYAAFERVSPTFGRVFAWGLTACLGFPQRQRSAPLDIRAEGAAPIVVVGTTRDPATPYAWSEALAAQLASGVLVTREGDGHTGYRAGNDCVDAAVEDYLVEGAVPEDGLTC